MNLHLHGLGHFHPVNEISNRFLEELDIGTNDEWILDRVGIRSRRTVLPLDYIQQTRNRDVRAAADAAEYTTADLGLRAALVAVERAGINLEQLGMVISGSSAPDSLTPADACRVAAALDLDVPAFDLNSACTSLLAQVHFLTLMRAEALPEFVLLIGSDALTRCVDYSDRATAVLWGDGAAAAVVSTRVRGGAQLVGTDFASRPSGADHVRVSRTGHFGQNGRVVQSFAIRRSAECFEALRAEFETPGAGLHFVGHQANLRMLEAICRRCEIPDDRHHSNVEWYGNTGAASSGSVVSMLWEKWADGDDVAVVGIGGGLSWSRYLIRFRDRGFRPGDRA